MTQEDKKLLLKDLCARLPYGIKCKDQYGDYINVNIYNAHIEHLIDQIVSGVVQMVLRPMSSMTKKEIREVLQISNFDPYLDDIRYDSICFIERCLIDIVDIANFISWLNKHHFDYRGLIEKGLALEAPTGMYK